MILLALSTSGRAASAALLKEGVPLAEATRDFRGTRPRLHAA